MFGVESICVARLDLLLFLGQEVVKERLLGGLITGPMGNTRRRKSQKRSHESLIVTTNSLCPVNGLENIYIKKNQNICVNDPCLESELYLEDENIHLIKQ